MAQSHSVELLLNTDIMRWLTEVRNGFFTWILDSVDRFCLVSCEIAITHNSLFSPVVQKHYYANIQVVGYRH